MTDDIAAFIQARLDEDARTWALAARRNGKTWVRQNLRGVEAKRRLVAQQFEYAAMEDGEWGCCHDAEAIQAGACYDTFSPSTGYGLPILRLLASEWSDHPDYRMEWSA